MDRTKEFNGIAYSLRTAIKTQGRDGHQEHVHTHNGTQREEECHPMWKPSPLLLQTIKVTINHKLVPLWVQIQMRERDKEVSQNSESSIVSGSQAGEWRLLRPC